MSLGNCDAPRGAERARSEQAPVRCAHAVLLAVRCACLQSEVYRLNIDIVMCGEAHFLKNGEAQITQAVAGLNRARRRLLMSGTPIQNDLSGAMMADKADMQLL